MGKQMNLREEAEAIKASLDQVIPPEIRERMANAGLGLTLGTAVLGPFHIVEGKPAEAVAVDQDQLAEEELLEEMGSYEKDDTGIENVVFLSPRGRTRHAARIKVAIDPPDSFNPAGKTASIAIHDGSVTGERVPRGLYEQLLEFIDLNRETLLDYWDYKISTTQMERRLKPIPPKDSR
jgi:hypothetical protein